MLTLDGSQGEGGGQILRTALALSIVTDTPFRLTNIRARRSKPGLMRQHLTAVEAAAKVGGAKLHGAALGSKELYFEPGKSARGARGAGEYSFAIGSAGSATLVLQTVLPPLLLAEGESVVRIHGGTHNMHAPPFDFLAKSFVPLLNRMGPSVEVTLVRHGFYPAGGGEVVARIRGPKAGPGSDAASEAVARAACEGSSAAAGWKRFELLERGAEGVNLARSICAHLPPTVARRELDGVRNRMKWPEERLVAEEATDSRGPGNVLLLELAYQHVTEVVTAFGARDISSDDVAKAAVEEATRYLSSDAPVGEHLADQLLLPMALGAGGVFRTRGLTPHTMTNIDTIQAFLDIEIETQREARGSCLVRVGERR